MSVKLYEDNHITLYNSDCRNMADLADETVQCVVTSPPYWGLRKYSGEQELIWDGDKDCEHQWDMKEGKYLNMVNAGEANRPWQEQASGQLPDSGFCSLCGAWKGAFGLEPTPEMYVQHTIEILREIRRVLRKDGVVFWNIGDSYWGSGGEHYKGTGFQPAAIRHSGREIAKALERQRPHKVLKPKDLCLIPSRIAIAAQEDGWWVRSVIIWNKCLSGNTPIYAQSNGRALRTTIRELYRLRNNPLTLPSFEGAKPVWNNVTSFERLGKRQIVRITLRNGFWITCTPEHRFPTFRGLLSASEIHRGDVIRDVSMATPEWKISQLTTYEFELLVGWFLAEGNYEKESCLRFSLNSDEREVAENLGNWAEKTWGATWRIHDIDEHSIALIITSKVAVGAVKEFLWGKGAKQKHFSPSVWNTDPRFLAGILDGWLKGDIGYDRPNNRYRGGFSYNRELAEDIRLLCSLLGYSYRSSIRWTKSSDGKKFLSYQVEIRKDRSSHRNNKPNTEVMEVGFLPSPQDVYEITVDGNHLFTLPDGSLTHNSNPMPESVTDRPTNSYEFILMLTKSKKYYWDADAVREPVLPESIKRDSYGYNKAFRGRYQVDWEKRDGLDSDGSVQITNPLGRNLRDVWKFPTQPYPEAHFAVFPEKLPEICIKAATSEKGCCPKCGKPWVRVLDKKRATPQSKNWRYQADVEGRSDYSEAGGWYDAQSITIGWQPSCHCERSEAIPCMVLDPFMGTGTTLWVAKKLGRRAIGYDISEEYCRLAVKRNRQGALVGT